MSMLESESNKDNKQGQSKTAFHREETREGERVNNIGCKPGRTGG